MQIWTKTPDRSQMMRMRIACWITKAVDTQSEYVKLIAFHGNGGYRNAPHFYVCTYVSYGVCVVWENVPVNITVLHYAYFNFCSSHKSF